jgi:sugar phosphate isomerase/epimerase
MKFEVSLSTCWCSGRHEDGYEMLREIADLGFQHAELSHGIRVVLMPGILKAVEEGWIKISSTHNFCPLPVGVMHPAPNYYQPSSPSTQEREMWVRQTLATLDFTKKLNAHRIVMHSGSVIGRFLFNPFKKVEKLKKQHGEDEDLVEDIQYLNALDKAKNKMLKKAKPALQHIVDSYSRVLPRARELGLKLCAENREGFMELPLDEGMSAFLDSLPEQDSVGYWHDTGHAQIKQEAGLTDQFELLSLNSDRLTGFHIHDVTGDDRDHSELGTGRVNIERISQFFQPSHALVLELHPALKTEQVNASHEILKGLLKKRSQELGL